MSEKCQRSTLLKFENADLLHLIHVQQFSAACWATLDKTPRHVSNFNSKVRTRRTSSEFFRQYTKLATPDFLYRSSENKLQTIKSVGMHDWNVAMN